MIYALLAAFGIAAIALIGALFFGNHPNTERLHRFILPAAVGVFLGIVFFELIPETLEMSEQGGAISILIGFLGFYLLSHFLETYHHHHHHDDEACTAGGARKLLIGDSIHNLADGIVIASSFMINPVVGFLTAAGIALHEVPQEIAEYAVLRAGGYSQRRALFLNFLSASTVVLGVLLTYLIGTALEGYMYVLTGIAAGNLLYIATADLIPELRHSHRDHFAKIFLATIVGVILIGGIITLTHGEEGHDEEEIEVESSLPH
jgi:zinc and cadmium transporter